MLVEGVGGTTLSGSLYGIAWTDDTIAAYLSDGNLPSRSGASVPASSASLFPSLTHGVGEPVHGRVLQDLSVQR